MFCSMNRTLFDIPIIWNRSRFDKTRSKYRQARKLIQQSINIQFQKELKTIRSQNQLVEQNIFDLNQYLSKHDDKVLVFDNLTHIASESLPIHFERRMNHIRTILGKHFHIIQNVLQKENQYWKNIHSVLDQNLITSNDIHQINHDNFISSKQERLTYVTKPEEITNRIDLSENYPDFMEPKIVLDRIGQGFLIDCLKSEEDTQEIKAERQSYGQKRKQSAVADHDDENDSSISIIEIDVVTPKRRRRRRRNKKPKRKQDSHEQLPSSSSLTPNDQPKHFNTRLSIRNQQLNAEIHKNMTQPKY